MEWYVFAIGTAVLASVAAIIEKRTLIKENPLEFSTTLGLFNALISLPIIFFISSNISFGILLFVYLISLLGTFAFYLVAKAVRHMDISITSPLLNFESAILLVLAILILGEKIAPIQVMGISILVIGGYLLELPKNLNFNTPLKIFLKSKYIHFIFLALIIYAFSSLGDKVVLNYMQPLELILISHLFIAINYVIMISILQNGFRSIKHGMKKAWKYTLLMSLFTTSYRILQAQAMSMIFVSLVIPIKQLSTAISTFVGGEFFHEKRVIFRSLIAIVMVIGAALVILG
jgi:drug/metabolite transporter (DMT)-like permease